jgi:hypothetical protein
MITSHLQFGVSLAMDMSPVGDGIVAYIGSPGGDDIMILTISPVARTCARSLVVNGRHFLLLASLNNA